MTSNSRRSSTTTTIHPSAFYFLLTQINIHEYLYRFIFELPNNEASLLPVASCLVVKASNPEVLKNEKGQPIIRPYTPISPPDQKGELTLLVKKYDAGNASKHIHELKVRNTSSGISIER